MRLMDLMEPEETVGNLWHDLAKDIGADSRFPEAAVTLADLRPSLSLLFRALGGGAGVEIVEAAPTPVRHRTALRRRLGAARETEHVASFDTEHLRLPPVMEVFPEARLNRAAYFWLIALAASQGDAAPELPAAEDGPEMDCAQIRANARACDQAYLTCPGLRPAYRELAALCAARRGNLMRPQAETILEQAVRDQLGGETQNLVLPEAANGYMPLAPVPIWLRFERPRSGQGASDMQEPQSAPAPAAAQSKRKLGERRDLDQTQRRDSFIIHRFESILSWVEAMNINRSVDDDDENAAKAADDQDRITLSKHNRKAATRLRLHLDLSPSDAEHERLAGTHVYPEWNHRTRSYMEGHCRVLEAPVVPGAGDGFRPDPRHIRAVRRQFEALRPKRLLRPRQVDGEELDLEAVICTRADLIATGRGSDRIWQQARKVDRDLAVAFLIDTSRSTEAAIGDTSVINVAREAMLALSAGIDAAGDRFGIWGFSSLRRDRVFVSRIKSFADPMDHKIEENIAALKPGHFTRLGAAIRHVTTQLAEQTASRKLLIVLTDGKPNDLDHYEGQHGIEDSHMAVREARRAGLTLHGVIIDEDGQDWFARIFGRGGFTLLPHPERLLRALPDIYRSLTQES
ncbi:nitric oxide reductase activation protein NorD [Celeribacter naphthalenivorans]|uniref:nitric oxide reductase activation protein NorD n=1 Tax=Celeribacter naphthalenivorans TaxID=1614694 RepID=UPI001CFAB9F0|nr:VWA domain-containing protein [Celeribacter naphthalenivorans]